MHNFKKLEIWNKSMDFVTEIYKLTQTYPKYEIFGLSSQTQRAACSIPLNIAEGSAKSSTKDFIRFLEIAFGSSLEVETALIIARNLEYITTDMLIEKQNRITEIQKMIFKFKKSLDEKYQDL